MAGPGLRGCEAPVGRSGMASRVLGVPATARGEIFPLPRHLRDWFLVKTSERCKKPEINPCLWSMCLILGGVRAFFGELYVKAAAAL